jgi:hypothetical protein
VEDLSIVELWREFFVMSATLFVLERVSSEGVIVRDNVSFPIFKRTARRGSDLRRASD